MLLKPITYTDIVILNRIFSSWYQTALAMQLYQWVILLSPVILNVPANMLNSVHGMCAVPPPSLGSAGSPSSSQTTLPVAVVPSKWFCTLPVRSQKTELRIQYLKQQFQLIISLPVLSNSEHAGVVGVYRVTRQNAWYRLEPNWSHLHKCTPRLASHLK